MIDIQVALIAGSVSFLVSLLGLLSTFFVQRMQNQNIEKQIRTNVADKLLSLRLEHYPPAFTITERIRREKEPKRITSSQELHEICNELLNWKTGVVSLILSRESIDAFYELRDALTMGYSEKESFSGAQVEKIMLARNLFRRSLRHDVGFLHVKGPEFSAKQKNMIKFTSRGKPRNERTKS